MRMELPNTHSAILGGVLAERTKAWSVGFHLLCIARRGRDYR
jgi:hypothetical protein